GLNLPRVLSFLAGAGMITASVMTIDHFFKANYPKTIFAGAFCDISAFFNCDSSAFSAISQIMGVPLGFFGLFMGLLIVLGAVFPSEAFERTNKSLSLLNFLGVIALLGYSVFILDSLCLLCSGYYLSSIFNCILFAVYGIDRDTRNPLKRWVRPSPKLILVFALAAAAGAYGMIEYHDARKQAQTGTAVNIVKQYYELPQVPWPSVISPLWTARSTEAFEDAPIRIVEYGDLLCSDCLYLNGQLERLKEEFKGKINIAFQFFPLEGLCNDVVPRKANLHPGACELSYIAAYDPSKFKAIHDEVWANFRAARDPEWRRELAKKYGVEAAYDDPAVRETIRAQVETGKEYERTSSEHPYGIRSTPTLIINNRMIIGTLPYEHLKAIFQALVEEHEGGPKSFLENWVPPVKKK
ncbi:MAG: thioredoxin domain-containing protein, partial [Candidatus Aminicenantes bacterium]|nr:thioredoxin domain-containing protein [Candidatus Aminicenantes bacterium]